ncbi:MAG: helix-turn-helix domain-containing protein [Planctomycetota bacterium]|jgi:hypothetical protein
MASKRLFVRELDSKERTVLEALHNDGPAGNAGERVTAVDMSAAGETASAIATSVKRSPGTVRKWIHAFNAGGFDALGVSVAVQEEPVVIEKPQEAVKIEATGNRWKKISDRLRAAVGSAKPRAAHFGGQASREARDLVQLVKPGITHVGKKMSERTRAAFRFTKPRVALFGSQVSREAKAFYALTKPTVAHFGFQASKEAKSLVELTRPCASYIGGMAAKRASAAYAASSQFANRAWGRVEKHVLSIQAAFSTNA